MSDYKIIHDTVHGSIKLNDLLQELLESPELQRLHSIHQLGLVYLVFPGANHTRLEHSIGTCYVAERIAKSLGLDEREKMLVSVAALLHDIGHSPYSHTLELMLHDAMDQDHEDVTKRIIKGDLRIPETEDEEIVVPSIPEILNGHDIDPNEVSDLIGNDNELSEITKLDDFPVQKNQGFFNEKRYLHHIIHGAIDADQIDYLLRDAHYTGVAHGTIDTERLIETMEIFNHDLVVNRRGIPAVEGMLVARALMFSSVYFHKTVRIADLMLARAVEGLDEPLSNIRLLIDSELMWKLKEHRGYPREIAMMLKYRQLFKKIFSLTRAEVKEDMQDAIQKLHKYEARKEKERELCRKAGIPEGYAIIDVPQTEVKITEPRLQETRVKILNENKLKPLSKYTPLAKALMLRDAYDWEVMVSAAPKYTQQVKKAARKVLFD